MNKLQQYLSACVLATAALIGGTSPAWAQVSLGAAADFSVLGGTAVTCTAGVITGDVGVSPGTGFANTGCTIAGDTPPATNAAAVPARAAFLSAYAALQGLSTSCIQMPGNLSGLNLAPGVYCTDAVAKAGTLTLTGGANDVWIFVVNGALTGTNFSVAMAGGGQPCNVYWAPSAATTMTTSALKGNVLAGSDIGGSITLTGGTLAGRALANVAVTMTGASIIGCDVLSDAAPSKHGKHRGHDKDKRHCEDDDHGHDKHQHSPFGSNDKHDSKSGHKK